jgi:hypothetical protein
LLFLFVGAWNAVCNLLSQGIATRMFKFIRVLARFCVIPDVPERKVLKQNVLEQKF